MFTEIKRAYFRIGFRCWCGEEASSNEAYMERLIKNFEAIDPETGFVNPSSVVTTIFTRQSREKAALADIAEVLKLIWNDRIQRGDTTEDSLGVCMETRQSEGLVGEALYAQVAADVVLFQMASNTNLYAALSWAFIDLLRHPIHLYVVKAYAYIHQTGSKC